MTPLIKKAYKGNRDAMTELYRSNKQRVFYVCGLLLCDPKAADHACVHVFKNAWEYLLDGKTAPETVENFVALAEEGFYDGLTFHRIIEGFMMQGGDPDADGTGGHKDENGNEINVTGEFYYNGYDNYLSHVRGAISMARASDYDSASSQFFIVHEDSTSSLDMLYAAFGYVIEGMDVVDAVCEAAEPTDDNGTIEPADQPVITTITIYTPEEYEQMLAGDAA